MFAVRLSLWGGPDIALMRCCTIVEPGCGGQYSRAINCRAAVSAPANVTKCMAHSNQSLRQAGKYACVLYDTTFKVVLVRRENEELIRRIIELLIPGKRISSLTFIDKEQKGLVVSEKNVTFRFAAVTAAPRKSKKFVFLSVCT